MKNFGVATAPGECFVLEAQAFRQSNNGLEMIETPLLQAPQIGLRIRSGRAVAREYNHPLLIANQRFDL
jgi:hypothetical protein